MNNTIKFNGIPKSEPFKIPFKLKNTLLVEWLQEVCFSDAKQACLKILTLIQALNDSSLSASKRVEFLTTTQEYLKGSINQLPNECWDASFPLSSEEKNYAEIIAWNNLALADGFFIAANDSYKKSDKAYFFAMALQAMREVQLHIAATHSIVNTGFWGLIYEIFAQAEKRKLQHLEIKNLNGLTINTIFSQLLIFHVCDSNQYRSRDIHTLFHFLTKCCHNLSVEAHINSGEDMFMLDLDASNSPVHIKTQSELAKATTRYFSPVIIAEEIEYILEQNNPWSGSLKSINNTLFQRVIKTLKLNQTRRHQRTDKNQDVLSVIGFEQITAFLYKISKNKIVIAADAETIINAPKITNLEIYDPDYKQPLVREKGVWQKHKNEFNPAEQKVSLKKITLVDTSATGYSVHWQKINIKAKIGDIFGIISEDKKRLEIVIIRRLAMQTSNYYRFGVQILGFNSEIVYIRHANAKLSDGVWGILLPSSKVLEQSSTLIYASNEFKIGENFYIHRSETVILCTLVQELSSTSSITHVKLGVPSSQRQAKI